LFHPGARADNSALRQPGADAARVIGIEWGGDGPDAAAAAPPAPRLAGLTALRLALIAWVVLYHLDLTLGLSRGALDLPVLGPALRVGYLGVDGFFLLSGFALWLGYAARPPRGREAIAEFLVRRVAKIWPLHALALLALAALVGLSVAAGIEVRDPGRFGAWEFVLQLFLVNAWETTSRHAWNYPSWALSAECAGYLAFPLLLRAVLRPRGAAAVAGLAAAMAAGLFALDLTAPAGVGLNQTFHLGLVRFFLEFLLGLALGRLAAEGRLPRPAWLLALGTAAVLAGVLLGRDPVVVLGLAAVIAGVALRPAMAPPALLVRLGEASFGVYLCWVFVEAGLVLLLRATGGPPAGLAAGLALMGGAFLLCLALGWLAFRLVEVPAHRWIMARWTGRRRQAGEGAGATRPA
jgi:peptidoglycan/LPS O-acetylase OafA/YrhL